MTKDKNETAGEDMSSSVTGDIMDMNEVIKLLDTTRSTFYRWLRSGKIKGMKIGRQWRFYRSEIERFLKGEEPRIELLANIHPLIESLIDRIRQFGADETPFQNEGKVEQAVDLMINLATKMGASDIHLANIIKDNVEQSVILRYRLDGVLHTIAEIDPKLLPAIIERWKFLSACDIHERKKSQEGSIHASTSRKPLELRCCFLPTGLGESLTVRILDRAASSLELDDLGFLWDDKEKILRWLQSPWGIIVVSGPTGSGKSTVLYVCLRIVTKPELKAITVEDPVEFLLPWTVQIQVQRDSGEKIIDALRAVMRSDPDVIMIGEIPDGETMSMAHNCALTGHLVLTTMHANDAIGSLKNIIDMSNNPYVVVESTKLIISQRLVRKLCPECRADSVLPPEMLELAKKLAINGGLDWDILPKNFREPVGCTNCRGTGYKGRIAIVEILETTPEIVNAISNGVPLIDVQKLAVQQGMTTMSADGIRKTGMGITSLSEVLRVAAGLLP